MNEKVKMSQNNINQRLKANIVKKEPTDAMIQITKDILETKIGFPLWTQVEVGLWIEMAGQKQQHFINPGFDEFQSIRERFQFEVTGTAFVVVVLELLVAEFEGTG